MPDLKARWSDGEAEAYSFPDILGQQAVALVWASKKRGRDPRPHLGRSTI
jgi:hypothetical protein